MAQRIQIDWINGQFRIGWFTKYNTRLRRRIPRFNIIILDSTLSVVRTNGRLIHYVESDHLLPYPPKR